ncbi:MAG: TonB-dependent receptor [Terracidiphilus sp.]|jgi:hypothetical protein
MIKTLRTALVLTLFVCASFLLIAPASAQSVYGSIFGTVTDSTGAAIAGATITVTDEAKGTSVTATSNGAGDYSVPHLIPDVYDLRVAFKGFKAFETKGIQVEADTAPRIDPIMVIGGGNESVEVNAESQPELKTDRADVSTVFNEQQVSSLPVGDQNFTNLQLLLPGAQILGWSHAADENPQGSKQIQVDGQAFGGTAFELDGTDNQDPILGIIVINPAMDAVTETKVTMQNYDAELGKAVSAVVTAQTRSGTNQFHGSAYDFRTGNANQARDPYSSETTGKYDPVTNANGLPAGLKNRFGGSIGGPILKNKAFFFGNYEAQRQKVGTSAQDTLPTTLLTETALGNNTTSAAQLAVGYKGADLSEYATKLGTSGLLYVNTPAEAAAAGVAIGQQYPDNVIPASVLSTPVLNLLKVLEPYTKGISLGGPGNLNGLDNNFHETGTGLFNSNQWTERVDYALSEKMHAFERFSRFWDVLSGTVMFGDAGGPGFGIGGYGGTSQGSDDSLASGMDIAVSSKLLTDFRLGYMRYNINDQKYDGTTTYATTLGMPGLNVATYPGSGGAPGFFPQTLPGGTQQPLYGGALNINRCNCPLTEKEDQGQIVNNWTMIWGNHTFKAGADLRYGRNLRVPSDTDRAGDINFSYGPTSGALGTTGGLGLASFLLGDVSEIPGSVGTAAETNTFGRYVGNTTEGNAKEFQKRTFFYGEDAWRVTHNLTVNLGLRWELYFPETVNGPGNGALMNLNDGYLHVAEIGGIPSDMGWSAKLSKQFAPRISATYQFGSKTVIRAGYGRSFDIGVFGSIFGHTVTQNLPVLANQEVSPTQAYGTAFNLSVGPPPNVFPVVPNTGLLPNPGHLVTTKVRPNPLAFPTIDAWNLSVQRALTPTLTLTVAYVGNKGTHTLGDGDNRNTNPNEAAISLPGSYNLFNGQTLHYDPSVGAVGSISNPTGIAANGGTSTQNYLQRYFFSSLPACVDSNYVTPTFDPNIAPGMCGWDQSIFYQGDNQNTEYDALQVTLAQTFSKGLAVNVNYNWAAAFDENSTYWTWSHKVTREPDSNVRRQSMILYGSYDLPFGKGKQYLTAANRWQDLIIGGYQLSTVLNWSGGLPFGVSYNKTSKNVPGSAPNFPSASGKMKTSLAGFDAAKKHREFYAQQIPCADIAAGCTTGAAGDLTDPIDVAAGTGIFVNPGLDNIGNVGYNTYRGPGFFNEDLGLSKAFTIRGSIATKFRMDAYNVFNHINPGNPGSDIESEGDITGQGPGGTARYLEFSLRVQF